MGAENTHAAHPVWDWVVRGSHWSFAVGVVAMWWTAEQGNLDWHSRIGYALLVLVITRLIWGLVGSYHARFAHFLAGPRRIIHFVRHPEPTTGHNPLGGWSVMALLTSLLLQAITGLFNTDDVFFDGPFAYWGGDASDTLAMLHEVNWGVLQALIVLHLSAIAYYHFRKKEPLLAAMIKGQASGKTSAQAPRPQWPAFLIAAMVAGALWWLISIAPEAPSYY